MKERRVAPPTTSEPSKAPVDPGAEWLSIGDPGGPALGRDPFSERVDVDPFVERLDALSPLGSRLRRGPRPPSPEGPPRQ